MRDGQHLIFDADDTLWENNVVFEGVIADFITWIDHPRLPPGDVRRILDEVEALHAVEHGYGTKVFALTLEVTAQRLREGDLTPADREAIAGLITRLAWDQLDIIDGVPDTLAELRGRHDLLLLTKGNHEEQAHKIDRSGLAPSLPPHRHHAREDGRDLPRAGRRRVARPGPHVDDRELAALRHPAGGRGRAARGVRAPRAHVAPGALRAARGARPHPALPHFRALLEHF